ncbi:unnamed protein product, partial [Protopolystoma xenopodis]
SLDSSPTPTYSSRIETQLESPRLASLTRPAISFILPSLISFTVLFAPTLALRKHTDRPTDRSPSQLLSAPIPPSCLRKTHQSRIRPAGHATNVASNLVDQVTFSDGPTAPNPHPFWHRLRLVTSRCLAEVKAPRPAVVWRHWSRWQVSPGLLPVPTCPYTCVTHRHKHGIIACNCVNRSCRDEGLHTCRPAEFLL